MHGKVHAPNFLSSLCHSPSSPSDDRTQKIFSRKKRKRDKGDAGTGTSGSSAEVMIDMTTDTATDITIFSTQTPASSVDFDIFLRINPRLLTSEVEVEEQERKIKKYTLAPTLLSILR